MTIAQIKSSLSIEEVLNHYGLKADRWHRLLCPWHNDKKPSLQIYPDTNTWTCFSTNCDAGSGDVIEFIQRMEKTDKAGALRKAASLIKLPTVVARVPIARPELSEEDRLQLLSEVFSYFRKSLKHSKSVQARDYLASRGLSLEIEQGYNSGGYHQRKPQEVLDRCLAIGLLKISEGGHRSWAKGCIIYPLKDEVGRIVSLYGRTTRSESSPALGMEVSKKGAGHFYLRGRRGLYPFYPSKTTAVLILTESIIDAATLGQLELPLSNYSILSLYGVKGFGEEHRKAIFSCTGLQEIIFILDGDEAGSLATEQYSSELKSLYPNVQFSQVELPDGEDVNSLYVLHEDRAALFDHLFCNRQGLGQANTIPSKNQLNTSNPELLIYDTGLIQILVLGGIRIDGLDRLRATLKVSHNNKSLRHSLDLYNGDQLDRLCKKISSRLELSGLEVEELLDALIESLEAYRLSHIDNRPLQPSIKELTVAERAAAKKYLSDPDLMARTLKDLGKTGIVGEELNRLLMYIVMTSRKRSHPLHVMSLAASGQGKTHLQERVSACLPAEDKLEITSLSDNALYYFGKEELRHKLLLIEDLDGAEGVLYPLRELQSKRRITKRVTLKDRKGRLKTQSLEVEGPVSVAGCTTRERLYEDNANRSFLLYLDESAEQDERIMAYQRSLSAGKIRQGEEEQKREELRDTQRILKNIEVRNPYAEQLQIPSSVFKPRRTNGHYLAFIEAITFYHQYQREVKTDPFTGARYIETNLEDIRWANKLLAPVLLRKSDELSGACRSFLEQLKTYLKTENQRSFYSKQIRSNLRLSYSTLKRHLINLTRNGYLKIVSGNASKGYEYEVVSYEEYQELQQNITTVLDEILAKISKK